MEYFKERIEPTLPEIPYFGADFLDLAGTFSCEQKIKVLIIFKNINLLFYNIIFEYNLLKYYSF